ncbi:hypothetical protein SZN_26491 [Streptomyces zinciresistens K42]|uniref:Uncharacterized protein n=1 Tax=Streptomyces zinciresistens K42 TaxID=700597 RepID=G2GIF8_9ACTN|nr:hypothetical protein SZN_26491 [Streptomyces zinciresistens K42]
MDRRVRPRTAARWVLAAALLVLVAGMVVADGLLIAVGLVVAGIAVDRCDPERGSGGGRDDRRPR